MNFIDVIRKEFLFESKKESVGALKVFYDINISIKEDAEVPEQIDQQQQQINTDNAAPTQPVVAPAPVAPPVVGQPAVQESINEDVDGVEKKLSGVLSLTKEDADNIQSIEDLIDFMADKKDKGEKILDELTVEVITSLIMSPDAMKMNDIIKKDDQIIITIFYGYKKENSIGFKILKRRGVSSVSTIMLKDNEVLDAQFDFKKFNSQIVDFRNEWLNK
jgi:hypothetical protein